MNFIVAKIYPHFRIYRKHPGKLLQFIQSITVIIVKDVFMIDQIFLFLIFFGGAMSWTIAIGQLLERRKQTFNYMFAGFMFSVGVVQFSNGIIVTGKVTEFPFFAFMHLPFLALAGPTFYFCFKSVIGSNYRLKWTDLLHGVIPVVIAVALIPYFRLNPFIKGAIIMNPPSFTDGCRQVICYSVIVMLVVIVVLGYMIFFLKECSSIFSINFIRESNVSLSFLLIMFIIYPIGFAFFISIVLANVINYSSGFYIGIIKYLSVLSFFLTFLIYTMSRRNNNYFQVLRKQTDKNRYEKSKIKNLDVSQILSRIKLLMTDEKIFLDEDLSLNSFASELEIGPYQLSQIINENFNKNFNAFINEYRIEEAKVMLINDRDRTIVSVSYAVGFNSPATFYEWFYKITGVSPSKFRKMQ